MKHKIRDGALYKFLSLESFFSWQNVHVANSKMENDFLINQLWFEWYEKKRDFMIGDPFFCVILISTCNYKYNCPLFPQKTSPMNKYYICAMSTPCMSTWWHNFKIWRKILRFSMRLFTYWKYDNYEMII